MKYTSVFRVASCLNSFIKDSMTSMGNTPHKVSIETMIWRFSNTMIGSEILNGYSQAMSKPELWRENVAFMLQCLSGIFRTVKLCTESTNYDNINKALNSYDKVKLNDIVEEAATICKTQGYSTNKLFEYIMECRNIYVHSGVMPYIIFEGNRNIGLNDFLKNKFEDDPVVLASLNIGCELFNDEGDSKKFKSLCDLILSALSFYFDSLNPSLSKYAPLRYIELYFTIATHMINTAIMYVIGGVFFVIGGALALLRGLITACIVAVIAIVVLLISSKVIGFFSGSNAHYSLTEVAPQQLVEWVDEMSPYEQMMFIKDRKSALTACELRHRIGDAELSPADRATENLYDQFKDYPDPTAHPFRLIPNAGHLANNPFFGWPLTKQWGGEKLFTSAKSSTSQKKIDYLPIYEGDYYPLCWASSRNPQAEKLMFLGTMLAKYPNLDILILLGSGSTNDRLNKENNELAQIVKQIIIKAGVKSKNIRIVPDLTKQGGIVLAVGGISQYTQDK